MHIEGATIGNTALISSGSVVLNGASVGEGAVVAVGVPARVREDHEVPEGRFQYAVDSYVQRGRRFRAELRRIS